MSYEVTDKDIQNYSRDGAVVIRELFSAEEVEWKGLKLISLLPAGDLKWPAVLMILDGSWKTFAPGRTILHTGVSSRKAT